MSTTAIREALALAIVKHKTVVVGLRDGYEITCVPHGTRTPRWWKLGNRVVHQYEIVEVKEVR